MKPTATDKASPSLHAGFHPVATAGPRMQQIFLMDMLKDQNTIEAVLANYIGLFDALRGQPMHYIVLVTFDVRAAKRQGIMETVFRSEVDAFSQELRRAVPDNSQLELKTLSTDELCALLKQAIPGYSSISAPCEDANSKKCPDCTANVKCQDCIQCDSLQYPSIFAQDPFVALDYGPNFLTMLSSVVSPVAFSYSFVAGAIANGRPADLRLVLPTRLNLVGGNILTQPDYAIVGLDTFLANHNNALLEVGHEMPDSGYTRKRLTTLLKAKLGVSEIFWAGTKFEYANWPYFQQGKRQPAFHVDYYLTPAGPHRDPDTGEIHELIFVGQLDTFQAPTDPNSKHIISLMDKGLEEAVAFFKSTRTPAGHRFKVVRVPLLLVGVTLERTVTNKLLSYNQVLLQTVEGKTTVFMPDYTGPEGGYPQPEYDPWQRKAIKAYESVGFEVVVVKGKFRTYSFLNGGSLHCIAKVTARQRPVTQQLDQSRKG